MTHDELLAILKPTDTNFPVKSPIQVLNALRAVVELHKPTGVFCAGCGEYYDICPTIQAIEENLHS